MEQGSLLLAGIHAYHNGFIKIYCNSWAIYSNTKKDPDTMVTGTYLIVLVLV